MINNETEKFLDGLFKENLGPGIEIYQPLSKEDIIYLFKKLQQNPQITQLKFGNPRLDDELMVVLLACLQASSITQLKLKDNSFTSKTAPALAELIKSNQLTVLIMRRTNIDDKGAAIIARAYADHARLETFKFSSRKYGVEMIEIFKNVAELNTFGNYPVVPTSMHIDLSSACQKRKEIQNAYEQAVEKYDRLDAALVEYASQRDFIKVDKHREDLRELAKFELTLPTHYQRKQLELRRKKLVVCEQSSLETVHCLSKVRLEQFLAHLKNRLNLFIFEPSLDYKTLTEYKELPKDDLFKEFERLIKSSFIPSDTTNCDKLFLDVFNRALSQNNNENATILKLFTLELKGTLESNKKSSITDLTNEIHRAHAKLFANKHNDGREGKYSEFEKALLGEVEMRLDEIAVFFHNLIDELHKSTISILDTLSELSTTSAATLGHFSGQAKTVTERVENNYSNNPSHQ